MTRCISTGVDIRRQLPTGVANLIPKDEIYISFVTAMMHCMKHAIFQFDPYVCVCQVYNGDLSLWTPLQITTAAGIVTGLPALNIANMILNDIEAINAIGTNGNWSSDQVRLKYTIVKNK
jgi:hypothetical protein